MKVQKGLLLLLVPATFSCKIFQPTQEKKAAQETSIVAAVKQAFQPKAERFEILPAEPGAIQTTNGTAITFPRNTFAGKEKITLEVRETVSSLQGYSLDLPMQSETGEIFESDGMFRLDSTGQLNPGAKIQVAIRAQAPAPMNVYAWKNGAWKYQGKNQYKETSDEETILGDTPLRSYYGAELNQWYNFDRPIPADKLSCAVVHLPTLAEKLEIVVFSNSGRSLFSLTHTHTQTAGISFLAGEVVTIMLLGPANTIWTQKNFTMPASPGHHSKPETCYKLNAQWRTLPPDLIRRIAVDPYDAIRRKFGRIARIDTKSGETYIGYFNQQGPDMAIETPSGRVSIPVKSVQRVTPINQYDTSREILLQEF